MTEYEMPIDEQIKLLAREFKTFGTKLDSIDTRLTSVETKLTTVETKLELTHALASRTHVLLESTHAVAKLGLEGVEGLQQSTDAKFAAAAKHNGEQTELLKDLFVHIRKRVERVEPAKRRRRP